MTRRRRHRRRGRDRRRDRRGARSPGRVRRHRRSRASRSTARPGSGDAEAHHRAADRRRRRAGPGVEHLGHRRRRGPRAVRRARRRVRRARRGRQRRRHQPPHRLRLRRRGRLAGGARACTSTATSTCSAPRCRIMAAAGHGRILGVTSGSGWRAADAGAYSCAKRAVAALTWQIGQATPERGDGQRAVADRRDPDGARARLPARPARATQTGRDVGHRRRCASLDVGAAARAPRADRRLPRGRGLRRVVAAGRSCSRTAPRSRGWSRRSLLEVARTTDVGSLAAAAGGARPGRARAGRGRAGQQRWREPPPRRRVRRRRRRSASAAAACGVAASSSPTTPRGATRSPTALASRGVECVDASVREAGDGFDAAAEQLAAVARDAGPVDARRRRARRRGHEARGVADARLATGARRARRDHRPDRAPTRRGSARSPISRRRATGRSGSSPSSTPRRPAGAAGPRRPRSSPAPRTRRRRTGSTPSRSAWRAADASALGRTAPRSRPTW